MPIDFMTYVGRGFKGRVAWRPYRTGLTSGPHDVRTACPAGRKGPRYGCVVAALALNVAALAAQTPAPKPAPPGAPPGRVDAGGALFRKVGCYQCHGNEAQGGLSGPRIGPNLFPLARFVEYLRKPTGEMPPYSAKVLTDQDIADIFAWVQARPRPPAVNTLPQLAP